MMATTEPVVVVEELAKVYPKFRFGPVSFCLSPGYVYGMVGPNGAGKTTLLKLMMNLMRPTSGSVTVFGQRYKAAEKAIKKRIGFVPEEPFLYANVNAKWFGRFVGAQYPSWRPEEYVELLEQLGVDATKTAKTLSRGTKVKLELALAMAHHPELLILDELTSGLDPLVRREILDQIRRAVQDEQRTVVFSTHNTEDVERIADVIIYVVNGKVALMEQREILRDNWQELVLDAADVTRLPGLVRVKGDGESVVRAVTNNAPQTLNTLRSNAKSPLHRRPLALDEILAELVHLELGG